MVEKDHDVGNRTADKTYKDEQIVALEEQIAWALEYDLPLVIHSREAFDEIYSLFSRYKDSSLRGIFHSFTGTADEAQALLEFPGFLLGINGVATFKKSTILLIVDISINSQKNFLSLIFISMRLNFYSYLSL